jgi:hypothetical protein
MSKTTYYNQNRVIPAYAPIEDTHWRGGHDTMRGHCEEGYEYVSNPHVSYGGYCRKRRRR